MPDILLQLFHPHCVLLFTSVFNRTQCDNIVFAMQYNGDMIQ